MCPNMDLMDEQAEQDLGTNSLTVSIPCLEGFEA